jgi:putative ABC transport system permease protein
MNVSGIDASRSAPLLLVPQAPSLFQNGPPQVIAVGIPEGKENTYYGDAAFGNGTGSLTGKDQAVLGSYAANTYYKVNVGDQITIQNHKFTVAGIADNTGSIITDGMVLIPLSVAQEIFNRPGVSTVLLAAPSDDKVDIVASAVRSQFSDLQVMTQDDMDSTLSSMASMTHTFIGMIDLTMLIVAGVVTLMVMFMSVSERTKEFGMLRAIGARRSRILALVLEEAVIVCIVGSVLGIFLSFLMMKLMFGGTLFSLETTVKAVIYMTVIGVIAGLIPAYRSAKIQPLEAIRYE